MNGIFVYRQKFFVIYKKDETAVAVQTLTFASDIPAVVGRLHLYVSITIFVMLFVEKMTKHTTVCTNLFFLFYISRSS